MGTKEKPNSVTHKQFIAHMNKGNKVYMKKPKSWQRVWFWWEPKSENWFLNRAPEKREDVRLVIESLGWFVATQVDAYLNFMERQGYSYYINKENE